MAFQYVTGYNKPFQHGKGDGVLAVDYLAIPVFKGNHYSLIIVCDPARLWCKDGEGDGDKLQMVLFDSEGAHAGDPTVFDGAKLLLDITTKQLHLDYDHKRLVSTLLSADCVVMQAHQLIMQDNQVDCGVFLCHYLRGLVESDFSMVLKYLYLDGVSGGQYRRRMRADLCAHASCELVPTLTTRGKIVPPQYAPRTSEIGAVRASDEVDMRSRLAQYQVEVYGLRRDHVIWAATVTALGNAMGYSRDQMLAAAAYVVKTDGGAYRSIEVATSPSTPPHLPCECTGGPLPADPCGAQSCATGGFVAHTDLGVIHQHPRPLPPCSRVSLAHDSPGGPKTPTNGNGEVGPGVRALTEVLLDTRAAKRREKRSRVEGGSLAAEGTTATSGGGESGGSSQYTGVRREKKRGTWSAKILVREPGQARRTQMRLGSYTQEPEAAYAYAAAAHVLRPGVVIPRTIQLTPTEQSLLAGCSKKVIKLLVRSRMWFHWREWEQAVMDCHGNMDNPEAETPTGSAAGGGGDEVEEEGGQDADVGMDDRVNHTAAVGVYATASAAPETSVAEAPQAEVEIRIGAGDEDIESESEARPAPSRSKNLASVMVESQATTTTRPRPPPVRVADNPFVAMPVAGSSRDPSAPAEETQILVSRAEFEALKKAQEASARNVARLEDEPQSAKAMQARAPPRRPDEHVSGSGEASGRKRRRREVLVKEETSDEESEDEAPAKRGHLRVSKSPVLQRALNFLPANKAWKFGNDREGMPFASAAFVACAVVAFKTKKVAGPLTVKLYHLAWLEHEVIDTLMNWEARKARLSNSACGNAQVVDGLVILAHEAVSNAIRIFKPKYDVSSCSWTWGRHGLRLSSCGLEDLITGHAAPRDGAEVQAEEISGSLRGP
ncbi:unnamed protein product [Closterium sp. NIES-65]|nr:unnamed protein product [Closterium sp. NIES-65]